MGSFKTELLQVPFFLNETSLLEVQYSIKECVNGVNESIYELIFKSRERFTSTKVLNYNKMFS